ncbi:MAG: TIGR02587 family membrane protein [Acidimicrobiales bacterium]|nr:TIGR02587 family membrane protein [Acidimicrobiales bacterium]
MPAATAQPETPSNPWSHEAVDLVRAVSGGLLFGIPLLYTMEVWWVGSYTEPTRVLGVLLAAFLPVWFLNRTSGFRSGKDVRLSDAFMDSIETVAIGILTAGALLVLLEEITPATPLNEVVGKLAFEAMPFSIGIALAQHFLRRGRDEGDDDDSEDADNGDKIHATVADVGATLIGAIFVAFNIAPTDEVPMIASALGPYSLIAVIVVSLVVSFCIVFVAGFSNEEQRRTQLGIFQHPISETVFSYLVALFASGVMLWYFQRFDTSAPWQVTLSYIIVLGLPASVGGAAGRLAA